MLKHVMETLDLFVVPGSDARTCATGKDRIAVDVLHERAAALDIGKRDLKACVHAAPEPSERSADRGTYLRHDNQLIAAAAARLVAERVSVVVMEATGDYVRHEDA